MQTCNARSACRRRSGSPPVRLLSSSVNILRRTRLFTRQNSATSFTGFVRKSSAPASRPRTRSSGWSSAVTMITGMCCVAGLALMRRHTSMPSRPGIITSSSTMSGFSRFTASSASTPFMAVTTSKYSAASFASRRRTLTRMSSTTRTRAVMRISSDIRRWSGGSSGRRWGEGGDRDDRDEAQLIVLLQPLRDLDA